MEDPHFDRLVNKVWADYSVYIGGSKFIYFKNKLKNLKDQIRIWQKGVKEERLEIKVGLSATLECINNMIDNGLVNDDFLIERREVVKKDVQHRGCGRT